MPNDMPTYNTLNSLEMRIIKSMRGFNYNSKSSETPPTDDPLISRVHTPLQGFMGMLWQTDPHVVSLNHKWDSEVTAFEVQLLYAISAARAGNRNTISELLNWWFPEPLIEEANDKLCAVSRILNDNGAPRQSCDRLREHILSLSTQRVRPGSFCFMDTETRRLPPYGSPCKTIH